MRKQLLLTGWIGLATGVAIAASGGIIAEARYGPNYGWHDINYAVAGAYIVCMSVALLVGVRVSSYLRRRSRGA